MYDINDPKFIKLVTCGIPIKELEKRLRPKNYSKSGFLGKKESLLKIVYNDWKLLESHGVSHRDLGIALSQAIKQVKVPNQDYKFENTIVLSAGYQECPWGCSLKEASGSSVYHIFDKEKDSEWEMIKVAAATFFSMPLNMKKVEGIVSVTELHPHLIEKHYFFEGLKTPYRADPMFLIKALNL